MKKSQKQLISDRLIRYGEVSNIWAVNNKILRLSERIRELKQRGYNIETFYKVFRGKRERTASYRLVK